MCSGQRAARAAVVAVDIAETPLGPLRFGEIEALCFTLSTLEHSAQGRAFEILYAFCEFSTDSRLSTRKTIDSWSLRG